MIRPVQMMSPVGGCGCLERLDVLALLLELKLERLDLVGSAQRPEFPVDERDPLECLPPPAHVVIRHCASEFDLGDRRL